MGQKRKTFRPEKIVQPNKGEAHQSCDGREHRRKAIQSWQDEKGRCMGGSSEARPHSSPILRYQSLASDPLDEFQLVISSALRPLIALLFTASPCYSLDTHKRSLKSTGKLYDDKAPLASVPRPSGLWLYGHSGVSAHATARPRTRAIAILHTAWL